MTTRDEKTIVAWAQHYFGNTDRGEIAAKHVISRIKSTVPNDKIKWGMDSDGVWHAVMFGPTLFPYTSHCGIGMKWHAISDKAPNNAPKCADCLD